MMILRCGLVLALTLALSVAHAADLPAIPGFIDEMVDKHHFRRHELERLFTRAQYQQAVIDAITAPATLRPWPEYRANFINEKRVKDGLKFWKRYARTLARAEERYGVPRDIIVALIGVETFYGQQTGGFRTVDALTTLAFTYPPRSDFFRSELEQYLLLAREQGFNLLRVQGSYAGALGIPQFMPSSYRKFAVDFNGSGSIDLLRDRVDAIGSVANYLKQYGWISGQPVALRSKLPETCLGSINEARTVAEWVAAGVTPEREVAGDLRARLLDFTVPEGKEFWLAFNNFDVIMRYNNSSFYAMSVLQLADALRAARGE